MSTTAFLAAYHRSRVTEPPTADLSCKLLLDKLTRPTLLFKWDSMTPEQQAGYLDLQTRLLSPKTRAAAQAEIARCLTLD